MKSFKFITTILILQILIIVFFVIFFGLLQIGYINYDYYFKDNTSQTNIKDELNIFVNVYGEHTEQKGIFVISKAPYIANITIGLSLEIKGTLKIRDIDFLTKKGDIIVSLDDCSSVYDSSKKKMIKENEYNIQNGMYMNFNYKGLKLPDMFYIQISYIYEDKIKNRTLLLKKSRRMYLTII